MGNRAQGGGVAANELVVPAQAGTHSHRARDSAVQYYVYILASKHYGT